jgi:Peptidase propeptide and YPEB domain
MRSVFATAALVAVLFAASPAPAQVPYFISSADAQAIAVANGVAVIYRLRLDEGVWKLEGRDVGGRFVRMRIDPRSGDVVSLDRGW